MGGLVKTFSSCVGVLAGLVLAGGAAAAAETSAIGELALKPIVGPLKLEHFRLGSDPSLCFDRGSRPIKSVVDSHLHVRPFNGPPIPFDELVGQLRAAGVLFASAYGIGQRLPSDSNCTYYLDCPGQAVRPSIKNDFDNAQSLLDVNTTGQEWTLSYTFPDLANPETIVAGMDLLDAEYPGMFTWMGEVNLVKQALANNSFEPATKEDIEAWAPVMARLAARGVPFAVHSDMGTKEDAFKYLPLMQQVLESYPNNTIIWMHLGMSKEQPVVDGQHDELLRDLLETYPNLYFDMSWRVVYDQVFSNAELRAAYVKLPNDYPQRFITGTDFVAAGYKGPDVYGHELEITSAVLRYVSDEAFAAVALGGNYFQLTGLDALYRPPPICPSAEAEPGAAAAPAP